MPTPDFTVLPKPTVAQLDYAADLIAGFLHFDHEDARAELESVLFELRATAGIERGTA